MENLGVLPGCHMASESQVKAVPGQSVGSDGESVRFHSFGDLMTLWAGNKLGGNEKRRRRKNERKSPLLPRPRFWQARSRQLQATKGNLRCVRKTDINLHSSAFLATLYELRGNWSPILSNFDAESWASVRQEAMV